MKTKKSETLTHFLGQLEYFNEKTIFILICGMLFTRLATDTWIGDRPITVILTIMSLVYLHINWGKYMTMLIRFPILIGLLYLAHVHFVQPGDFTLSKPLSATWSHLLIIWLAMQFTFLFANEKFLPLVLISKKQTGKSNNLFHFRLNSRKP